MTDTSPLTVRFGEFQLDEGNARLTRGGHPVELTPKAFDLLCTLLRQPGQLVVKDTLLDAVWGHRHVSDSVLKTTISQLRQALADDARQPRYIETASRRGYRFIAALAAPAAVTAVPAALPAAAAAGLVGRDGPLQRLQAGLAAALRGQRQLVLVAGEPGIGKSTLIDRFVAALPAGRLAHAFGQCVEHYGAGEPYMPVLEALNLLCRGDAGAPLVELMRRVAPTWLAQLPWYLADEDRRQLQREVAGATQDRMLREFGELLDRRTAQQPLLLVLEDLHWSDHATVQLLGYLARRRGPAALLLVGSFRPAEVIAEEHPLAGLRQELRLHRLCEEIDLESLSEAEVDELVADRLGDGRAPEAFVRALHAHTDGLPLFVVNLLDELLAEGALCRGGDGWVFPATERFSVPRSIVGVVEKQIARLPAEQQLLLGAASVAGVEFIHPPLEAALPLAAGRLPALLDDCAARGHWLRSVGVATLPGGALATRYAFRHALYRHVFYQRVGLAQRMQWHRKIAAGLLAAYGARAPEIAAELAMHFERGGDAPAAIAQLVVVARRALARSAAREAVRAVRHGLQLHAAPADVPAAPELELELRVLEGVALARLHVVSEPQVAAAFEQARALCERLPDSPVRARALHGLWWVSFARGELPQAAALAQRILALSEAGGEPGLRLAGSSALGVTSTLLGRFGDAQRHLEAALAAYAQIGDALPPGMFVQDPGVESTGFLALVAWWRGEPGRARRLAEEAVALAGRIRHPISELTAWQLAAALHYHAGEFPAALAAAGRIYEIIRAQGLPAAPTSFGWLHGHLLAAGGRVDEGFAQMHEAERNSRRLGMVVAMTSFHQHYAEACAEAGRLDEGLAVVADGLALAERTQERFLEAPLQRVLAELRLARGEVEAAAQAWRHALAIADAQGAPFHALAALVGIGRLPGGLGAAERERLQALLPAYRDEAFPLLAAARRLLAA